jgi:hypothetical protein
MLMAAPAIFSCISLSTEEREKCFIYTLVLTLPFRTDNLRKIGECWAVRSRTVANSGRHPAHSPGRTISGSQHFLSSDLLCLRPRGPAVVFQPVIKTANNGGKCCTDLLSFLVITKKIHSLEAGAISETTA